MHAHYKPVRVLRLKDILFKLNVARSTVYDWMNERSPRHDPSFPKRVKIGLHSVGWLESEVDSWILSRFDTNPSSASASTQP
ncbi:TPA: AlpA family phage regulatory protein [Aeromonas veronii]|uniref:helix-turn-helix transcriptional regulator n=1 Tax=Aeromonas veronii TaxID=654 RepID=UPI00330FA313|nr:AlpA family phage regulatory protein [Aeromonas veronii]HDO1336261.1 AlpA family phage regulatory protein [Aeromonas veronii]HDO1340782.1 AlpA family phage regulatory protein [Aeromonas veronii]HDO1345309.1 AlpA family phage regulatory protein [Aeromonas veronii]HDO1349884.1 AlpA family phage regulatory protein [Aeromonas veronii]